MVGPDAEGLRVEIQLARSPDDDQAWWTGIEDRYVAADPHEQPPRIEVLEHRPAGALLATYWRGPLGKEVRLEEELTIQEDGHWTFDQDSFGFHIHDDIRVRPTQQGTDLRIDVTITHSSILS